MYDIDWYINRLKNNEYYSFPGFSDAEWIAMEKDRIGLRTGGHQIYTEDIGNALIDALRLDKPNYLRAVPKCLEEKQWYGEERMDRWMDTWGIKNKTFYERDEITDELAKKGLLNSFIKQLTIMDTVVISNKYVRDIKKFLPYKHYIEIPKLDVYTEEGWLEKYTQKVLDYGKPAVYLFSAGFAAAPFIAKLHGKIPNSFFLDVGSIWDAFCGIGGQRGWRAELYEDPKKLKQWKEQQLKGLASLPDTITQV